MSRFKKVIDLPQREEDEKHHRRRDQDAMSREESHDHDLTRGNRHSATPIAYCPVAIAFF
jgi:hypothetical protein